MPELIEVELYRQAAAHTVGRRVAAIMAPDQRFLKGGLDRALLEAALIGRRVIGTRRRGKVALVDFDLDVVVGLRFGMTGRLVVDGLALWREVLELFGVRSDALSPDPRRVVADIAQPRALGAELGIGRAAIRQRARRSADAAFMVASSECVAYIPLTRTVEDA